MATEPRNFNLRHPERHIGEVFVGNLDEKQYRELPYATKRRGERACGTTGFPIGSVWPVFLKRIELQNSSIGQNVLKTLLREGVV